jgi:hypothetical protein
MSAGISPAANPAVPGTVAPTTEAAATPTASRETIESVIRGQRRMKGTILTVDGGRCIITGELGEFPFALGAVKQNKRFPDRQPKAGDRCDFKLSDTNPVKATSIRVMVPKSEIPEKEEGAADSTSGPGPISCSTNASAVNCVTASSLSSSVAAGQSSGIDDLCNAFKRFGVGNGGSSSLFSQ